MLNVLLLGGLDVEVNWFVNVSKKLYCGARCQKGWIRDSMEETLFLG